MWFPTDGNYFIFETFQLAENREDGSNFNDFWTELIALAWAIISDKTFERKGAKESNNSEKFHRFFAVVPRPAAVGCYPKARPALSAVTKRGLGGLGGTYGGASC